MEPNLKRANELIDEAMDRFNHGEICKGKILLNQAKQELNPNPFGFVTMATSIPLPEGFLGIMLSIPVDAREFDPKKHCCVLKQA